MRKTRDDLLVFLDRRIGMYTSQPMIIEIIADALINEGFVVLDKPREFWIVYVDDFKNPHFVTESEEYAMKHVEDHGYRSIHVREIVE